MTYLTFEEFIEALFVVSYAQVMLPSSRQIEAPLVEDLHEKIEHLEDDAGDTVEPTKRVAIGSKRKITASEPSLKPTPRKSSVTPSHLTTERQEKSKESAHTIEEKQKKISSPSEMPHVIKADEEYWRKGVDHLNEFLTKLGLPSKRSDTFRLIEEKRKRFSKQEPRYWDGKI